VKAFAECVRFCLRRDIWLLHGRRGTRACYMNRRRFAIDAKHTGATFDDHGPDLCRTFRWNFRPASLAIWAAQFANFSLRKNLHVFYPLS
jgi:hypothetical protein